MVFSSLSFLLYFLPAVLVIYYLIPHRALSLRNYWLLAASLLFYGLGGLRFLPLLLAVILLDYLCGLLAASGSQKMRRFAVFLAVAAGIALLGYYKYAGFLTENLAALGLPVAAVQVVLPVGISFFTFQGLSYVIDVSRNPRLCQKNPLYVALYVAFFPQLVAGPIVRYDTIAQSISARQESIAQLSAGLTRFCFGLGKKMLLANAMGEITDGIFSYGAGALPTALAWLGAVAYTFQIYFDFSAYSDMAIGLGQMFGFQFAENFNYPYISRSVTEFWNRWHISLSSWFRDYVYIPLGGNRRGNGRQFLNLLIVWLLTGLWHGAAWNYILWGLWFFLFLVLEKFLLKGRKLPGILGWAVTMLIVVCSWVLFRASGLREAMAYFSSMLGFGQGIPAGAAIYYLKEYWIEWVVSLFAVLPIRPHLLRYLENRGLSQCTVVQFLPKIVALLLLAASYLRLVTDSFNPFIYFQF